MSFIWLLSLLLLLQCDNIKPVSSFLIYRNVTRSTLNRWSHSPEDCGINWLPLEERYSPRFGRMPLKEQEEFERNYWATTPRIVGGSDSLRGEFPWSVAIEYYSPDIRKWLGVCNGAYVRPDWVLTAAHCLFLDPNATEPVKVNHLQIKYNADARRYNEMIPVKVADYFYYPKYVNVNADQSHKDFGLLRLEQNVTFERIYRPEAPAGQKHYFKANAICLPENPWTIEDDNENVFWMTSYGPRQYPKKAGVWPEILQKFMIVPLMLLVSSYDNNSMLAEEFRYGFASCIDDSGATIAFHKIDGRFFLASVRDLGPGFYNTTICRYQGDFDVPDNAEYVLNWIKGTIVNATNV